MMTSANWRRFLSLPVHVPLLALYPVIFIAGANPGQVETADVWLAVGVAVACGLAVLVILRPLYPSWALAGLAAVAMIGLFFSYGAVHANIEIWLLDAVDRRAQNAGFWLRYLDLGLSLLWLVLALSVLLLCRYVSSSRAQAFAAALNVGASVLFGLALVQLVFAQWPASRTEPEQSSRALLDTAVDSGRPDIYYIILDGYAREDVLARHYGFENTEFLQGLRERGFDIAGRSHSNYVWTFLSLASSLNLSYLDSLDDLSLDPRSKDRAELYKRIRDNEAARFLRARGYRFVHVQSTWGATARNPYADEFVSCQSGLFKSEFHRAIAEASWLRVLSSQASLRLADCYRSNFDYLTAAGRVPGPKFVFAHFIPPHHPYLFDKDGNVLRDARIMNQFEFQERLWERKELYLGQLKFMNREVLRIVDGLIADSVRPPIIVLQSDHGPQLKSIADRKERVRVRFANLTAALLPGAPDDLLGEEVVPVNLFRQVFDFYFNAGFGSLPARYFMSPYRWPYNFVELPEGAFDTGTSYD